MRLTQGDYAKEKVYSAYRVERAKSFERLYGSGLIQAMAGPLRGKTPPWVRFEEWFGRDARLEGDCPDVSRAGFGVF